MSLPSGVAALQHSANTSAAVVLPDGRGWAVLLARPGSRTSSRFVFRGFRRTARVSTRDATDESTFPWPLIGVEVFSTSGLDRPPGFDDGRNTCVAPSDRRPLHTSHCRGPVPSDTRTASRIARRMRAYALRPGAGSAVKSGARPSEHCSVCFVPSKPARSPANPPAFPLQGKHVFHRPRPVLGGMLGRGLLYSNSKSAQPVNSITYQPREVKYTSESADVHLHRLGPFLSMSLFGRPSDNREAHHANLAFDVRSASRTVPDRAH